MPFDLRPLFQALLALWTLLFQMENIDGNILLIIDGYVDLRVAFGIFFLAGLSEAYGTRAVTLFLNRLGRRPFFLSLVITSSLFVLGAVIWAFSIREIGALFFNTEQGLGAALQAVGIAYMPLLFAFLAFVPYLGPAILVVLQGLSLILATMSISHGFAVPIWEAAVITLSGWLILQGLRLLTAAPTTWLSRRMLQLISGRTVHYRLREIVPAVPMSLSDQGRQATEGES
jgi:hypothetical protein